MGLASKMFMSGYFMLFPSFPTPTRGKKSESQLHVSQVDEQDLGASDAVNPRAAESQVLLQRDHLGEG
jgi:hypothetical protein